MMLVEARTCFEIYLRVPRVYDTRVLFSITFSLSLSLSLSLSVSFLISPLLLLLKTLTSPPAHSPSLVFDCRH